MSIKIGVLALQGCVERHQPHIEAAGAQYRAVKTPAQFDEVDAFILPGGESTTMLKLIENFNLWDSLEHNFKAKPLWGICAGSILLAEKVTNPAQKSFAMIPVTVQRNGYGTQRESHNAVINDFEVSFIRAPIIKEVGKGVEVKATHRDDPVWVQKGNIMLTTFHPELTFSFPSPFHKLFVDMVEKAQQKKAA